MELVCLMWSVREGGNTEEDQRSVTRSESCFPATSSLISLDRSPQESDYFTPQGEFRVDKAGSPTLLNCLMYKMSYYRFGEMQVCHHK